MNVFRTCLKKEFGKAQYNSYVGMCKEELEKQKPEDAKSGFQNKEVYKDMYFRLEKMDPKEIDNHAKRLMEVLLKAFHIGRGFWFVLLFYLTANVALLILNLNGLVTLVSMLLMAVCFLYKLVEFLGNKYCFIDAYLVMIYKDVLECLSRSEKKSKLN